MRAYSRRLRCKRPRMATNGRHRVRTAQVSGTWHAPHENKRQSDVGTSWVWPAGPDEAGLPTIKAAAAAGRIDRGTLVKLRRFRLWV